MAKRTEDIMNAVFTPAGQAPLARMPAPVVGAKGKYRHLPPPRMLGDSITGMYADGSYAFLESFDRKGKLFWRVRSNKSGGQAGARKGQGYAAARSFVSDLIHANHQGKGISTQSPVKLADITSEAGRIWLVRALDSGRGFSDKTQFWNAFVAEGRANQGAFYSNFVAPVLSRYGSQITYGASSAKSGNIMDMLLLSKPKRTAPGVSPVRVTSGNRQTEIDYYRNNYGSGGFNGVGLSLSKAQKRAANRANRASELPSSSTTTY